MDDTGYDTDNLSAIWAEDVLLRFADHLMFDVPNVTIASKCCLEDPEWKPPFEAGIVITNFAFNGDESTPHLHMTFVPYSDNCSRGQKTQNALAQTFTRMGYKTTMEQARDASDELVWQDTPEGRKPQMVRTAEKALEAEREKERQENALYHIQTLSEKTIKKLDEEISAKNMTLECTDALIAIRKNDMVEWEEKTDLFDKVVDITYENEQLWNKIQVLQDKLEKAYEFMKQFVIGGRNMLDVFRERIGEAKEWVHRKVAGMSR